MNLDGDFLQTELPRDLLVGLAIDEKPQDFPFPLTKRGKEVVLRKPPPPMTRGTTLVRAGAREDIGRQIFFAG